MKKSNQLLALALSFATPALGTCFYASSAFSADILLGAYTTAGLLYIAATDYSPRTAYGKGMNAPKNTSRWIRRSFGSSNRSLHGLCTDKSTA